jgi:hypothetical protein
MLEVVLNFDQSHVRVLPMILVAIAAMPMLLAWAGDRELTWQPARWLSITLLAVSFFHLFLPGFTAERPRDMSLIYSETEGMERGSLVLESINRTPDTKYARGHGFEMTPLDYGWPETVAGLAREVPHLDLPGLSLTMQSMQREDMSWRRRFVVDVPEGIPLVQIIIDHEQRLEKAWVNGQLALDKSIQTKHRGSADRLRVVNPGAGSLEFELLVGSQESFEIAAVTWHPLPAVLTAPFMGNWPDDAQPFLYGPRAQKIQRFELAAEIPGGD